MPRKPRFFLPNVPVHIVQRGHSREPVFYDSDDYANYAYWIGESAKRYGVAVHSYVLMTNHTHLLMTAEDPAAISLAMQNIGRRYTPYSNRKYKKSGSIWEGRFKASLVQEENYLLRAMVYIELNPVRANMVKLPSEYIWSSFAHNIGAKSISFITPHSVYTNLGENRQQRLLAYGELFTGSIGREAIEQISRCVQTGTPLGNDQFREKIEEKLGRRVGYEKPGKPKTTVKRVLTPY